MYKVYFKNKSGQYHYGQPFDQLDEAIVIVFSLINVSPRIMITNSEDCSVFEAENGVVVWPTNIDAAQFKTLAFLHPIATSDIELSHLIAVQQLKEKNTVEWRELESIILASGAALDANLFSLGWSI